MEPPKIWNTQAILRRTKLETPDFLISKYIQRYSDQNWIVVKKQMHRSMEHNREFRNTSMHMWLLSFQHISQ